MQLFYHERNKFKPNNKQRRNTTSTGNATRKPQITWKPHQKNQQETQTQITQEHHQKCQQETQTQATWERHQTKHKNGTQNPNSQTKIKTNKIIILGIEGLAIAILITYIALSKFNKLTLKRNIKKAQKQK